MKFLYIIILIVILKKIKDLFKIGNYILIAILLLSLIPMIYPVGAEMQNFSIYLFAATLLNIGLGFIEEDHKKMKKKIEELDKMK